MVRIPDFTALEQPIVNPARPEMNVSRDALAAPGRAMAGLGESVQKFGVAVQAEQESADDWETKRRFVDFDLAQEKAFDEAKRNAGPEAKNFTPQYMTGYHENAKEFFKGVPESQRPKYDYMLAHRGGAFEKRAHDYELSERDKYHVNDVDTQTQNLRNATVEKPGSYKENLARGVFLIDGSRLPQDAKMKLRKQFAEGIEEDAIRSRIGGGEDPEKVIEDIKRVPRVSMETTPTVRPGTIAAITNEDRTFNSKGYGARTTGEITVNGNTYQFINGGSGRGSIPHGNYDIGRFTTGKQRSQEGYKFRRDAFELSDVKDDSPGTKGQDDRRGLLIHDARGGVTAGCIGIVGDFQKFQADLAIEKKKNGGHLNLQLGGPGSIEMADSSKVAQAGAPGVPEFEAPAGILESGNIDLKNRPRVINDDGSTSTIRSISVNEDGKEVLIPTISDEGEPLSDAAATALYKKTGQHLGKFDNADNATGYAKRLHDDQEAMIDADDDAVPYRYLTPQRRRTLINVAREAGRESVLDEIGNDIAQIRRTGLPKAGDDGRTSLDRAKTFLTPRQMQKSKEDWREAELEYQTVSPLPNMSESDALDHIGAMLPDDGDSDYATKVKVAKVADARLKQIVNERKKDPALSVNAAPEVRDAFDIIKRAGQAPNAVDGGTVDARGMISPVKAHEIVIEARIAAQRRLGIDEGAISPITQRQIADLLQIPDPRVLSDNDLIKKLKEASARAEETYGPKYAKMAFEAATRTIAKNQTTRDLVSPIVRKMIVGEAVTPEDYKAAESLSRAAVADVLFDPTAQGMSPMLYPSAPEAFPKTKTEPGKSGWIRSEPDKTIGPFTTAKEAKAFKQAAPPEAIQMLLDNPGLHIQFDQKYGPGSAAAALKR